MATANTGGANGFDSLKNYMRQSNDFIKTLSGLLQERSEAEINFSKALSKISKKLSRSCSSELTIYEAWGFSASEMDLEAEAHKNISIAIGEIHKQMKELDEMFSKNRKPHEDLVTKTSKDLKRMKCEERDKAKEAFNCHKDFEKARETQKADKVQKLDGKAQLADTEYKKTCIKLEEARQAYETAVYNGCHELQKLDEIRITKMKDMLTNYNQSISSIIPVINQSSEKISTGISKVNATKDMNAVVEIKGTMCNKPEQVLITFYAENSHNLADSERRRLLLQGHLSLLQYDATTTVKALEGIKKTMDVFKKDRFKNDDAYYQARHGYWQCHAKLEMLEASQYKISRALAELDGGAKPVSEYERYIEKTSEKGHDIWILRKPYPPEYPGTVPERLSPQKSCDDYDDEFGFQLCPACNDGFCRKHNVPEQDPNISSTGLGRFKAIYSYDAVNQGDLHFQADDIINVQEKLDDNWFYGELNGICGNVPSNYLERIG